MNKVQEITTTTIHNNSNSLNDYTFETVQELIDKFNDHTTQDVDKKYLKTVVSQIVVAFMSQPIKTKQIINDLTALAAINDKDIYLTIINLLGNEVNSTQIRYNTYMTKALSQAIWLNDQQKLNKQEIERLLTIALQKMELDVTNLELFDDLFDALMKANVQGLALDKFKGAKDELKKHLRSVKRDMEGKHHKYGEQAHELKFRLHYAHQALLRIGSDETHAEKIKRKLLAFMYGFTKIAGAVTGIASVALTGGGTAALAIPSAIEGILGGVVDFKTAFKEDTKANWYDHLRELQARIIKIVFELYKTEADYTNPAKHDELRNKLQNLSEEKWNYSIQFGIVDTLKQLIQSHPAASVKEFFLKVLETYAEKDATKEMNLQNRILSVLAEIEILDTSLQLKVEAIINKLNVRTKYNQIKQQAATRLEQPVETNINIIELGQQEAKKSLQDGTAGDIVEAILFENGSLTEHCLFIDNEVKAVDLALSPNETKEQHQRKKDYLNLILKNSQKIRAVMVQKGAQVKDTVGYGNIVTAVDFKSPDKPKEKTDSKTVELLAQQWGQVGVAKTQQKETQTHQESTTQEKKTYLSPHQG